MTTPPSVASTPLEAKRLRRDERYAEPTERRTGPAVLVFDGVAGITPRHPDKGEPEPLGPLQPREAVP